MSKRITKKLHGVESIVKTIQEKGCWIKGKKKRVVYMLPYIGIGYFCNKVAWLWRVTKEENVFEKVILIFHQLEGLFLNPFQSFHPKDILIGIGCGIGVRILVYYKGKHAKKFREGVEYGSARWGTAKDIEPYIDPVYENNILLTQTERLMLSGRPKNPKYARNKNILVIGGSGSGKTRFFVKPNLMQRNTSFIVTDPNR